MTRLEERTASVDGVHGLFAKQCALVMGVRFESCAVRNVKWFGLCEAAMNKHPESSTHCLVIEYGGARYGAVVQRDQVQNEFRVVSIWNQSLQQYLPLLDVEREYLRAKEAYGMTPIRSKRAARRRIKQYLRAWAGTQTGKAG